MRPWQQNPRPRLGRSTVRSSNNRGMQRSSLNRGNTLYLAQQYRAALESYDKAIRLKPDYAEAYHNRGSVLSVLQRREAALQSYDKAILFKPDYAEAYGNRGNTLYVLQQYQAALESYDKAILLKPELCGRLLQPGQFSLCASAVPGGPAEL